MKIKHLFVAAACSIATISSFVVSADLCVLTAALGGSSKAAASGSVSGKIQGIDVKPIYIR